MHKREEGRNFMAIASCLCVCVCVSAGQCLRVCVCPCVCALLMHWRRPNVVQNYLCVAHLTCTWQNIFCIYRMHFHHYPETAVREGRERERERAR